MRKLPILFAAALMLASCSLLNPDNQGNTGSQTQTPGGNGGNGSGNGSGSDPDPSANPYTAALKGMQCISYSQNKKTFDQTYEFHYNESGYLDYYLEHALSYNDDGVTTWADINYKRIYNYTSPTHADYYEDKIKEGGRAGWYDFDAQGRIIRKYNAYGDPYVYHYNDKGQLTEIENAFRNVFADDQSKYGSWKKSRIIGWRADYDCPQNFCQQWTSGSQTVLRNEMTILYNTAYTNPFRNMAIDLTVQEMTIDLTNGGMGLFDLEGWWGTRSKYLITGWFCDDNPENRVTVTLNTDKNDRIIGMTREIRNGSYVTRREYTFTWNGEAPLLKKDGIPVIN